MSSILDPSIKTRKDLCDWVFRQLGFPFVHPELRQEHINDFINDSIQQYSQYATGDPGTYAINLRDYVSGVGVKLPSNVLGIVNLYDMGINNSRTHHNPFSFNFMMANGGFVPSPFNGMSSRSGWLDYHMALAFMDVSYLMSGKGFDWQYNQKTHYLTLNPDPLKYFHIKPEEPYEETDGNYIVAQVLILRNQDNLYSQTWIKRMTLAKAKKFVGSLRKIDGNVTLPGGTNIDGDSIYNEGKQQQNSLREDLTKRNPILTMWFG